ERNCAGALGCGCRTRRWENHALRIRETVVDDPVFTGEVPPDNLPVEEIKNLIFLDWSADRSTELVAPFGWIQRRISVGSAQRPVPEEFVTCSVHSVATTACDGIDHAAHRTAEFRGKPIGQDLEFLNGILRDLCRNSGPAGVFVIETVCGVVAVGQKC